MSSSIVQPVRHASSGTIVLAAGLALACVAGCKVGPDYKTPVTPMPGSWAGPGESASTRPIEHTTNETPANLDRWWTAFDDATLTSLIDRALAGNLTLAQAIARVTQARASAKIAGSVLLPDVNASAGYTRSRSGSSAGARTSNLFRDGFDASWEIDVFGGNRRSVEAAEADLESVGFAREATCLSLAAEVASNYFALRGAQRQLEIAQQNLDAQRRTLALTRERFEAGFVSALDVANARAIATQTEAQIPSFETQVRTSIYALSVLLGQEPAALVPELSASAPLPACPASVPTGLPSDLLRRRPDIRQAEASLHAQTARVGVAISDQYPRFTLSGSFGLQGNRVESLGTLADRAWSFGPSVSLPIFTGGRVEGGIEQAKAVAEQASLAYRQAVLTALQDVESALVAFAREQQRQAAIAESADANRQAVDLSIKLYGAGRTDFLNVLSAQRQQYASEAQLVQSQTNVATNLVALFKALGGGWDVPKDDAAAPPAPDHSAAAPALGAGQ